MRKRNIENKEEFYITISSYEESASSKISESKSNISSPKKLSVYENYMSTINIQHSNSYRYSSKPQLPPRSVTSKLSSSGVSSKQKLLISKTPKKKKSLAVSKSRNSCLNMTSKRNSNSSSFYELKCNTKLKQNEPVLLSGSSKSSRRSSSNRELPKLNESFLKKEDKKYQHDLNRSVSSSVSKALSKSKTRRKSSKRIMITAKNKCEESKSFMIQDDTICADYDGKKLK